ncbi:Septum formation protein Maf [hydrothermal vent metagenome]|uniref:Septum formation protein Maf n=1 Tax=hydrothermal vent metagenome TaxID=652676 RepID=A0A3B0UTA5_9ZZZZ
MTAAPSPEARIFRAQRPLILASGSPRRRKMLADLGLDFEIVTTEIDETAKPDEKAEHLVKRLAAAKAHAALVTKDDSWILSADTAVVINSTILGKPGNNEEAAVMLTRLAGHRHEVWTGFGLLNHQRNIFICHAIRTEVRFADWPPEICRAYAATNEPLDKAGAYGIQGLGGFMIQEISGSYSNVVGLPLAEILTEMLRLDIIKVVQS